MLRTHARAVHALQGNDRGTQYRSGIFYHNEQQKAAVLARVAVVNEDIRAGRANRRWAGDRVVAQVEPAGDYYLAGGHNGRGRVGHGALWGRV